MLISATTQDTFLGLLEKGKKYSFSQLNQLVQAYNKNCKRTVTLSVSLVETMVKHQKIKQQQNLYST